MSRPRLTAAITWDRFEAAIHAVLAEALRRLATYSSLPNGEEDMNLWLHWLIVKSHHAIANSTGSLPFSVFFDGRSQPEPDDAIKDSRLQKRPDFTWSLFNQQATDPLLSQCNYYTECKRLGSPERGRVFNDLYSEEGIGRFRSAEHAYAKNCPSAAMVGYIQTTTPDAILTEVNGFATPRSLPSLVRAATAWATALPTILSQTSFVREFDTSLISLSHFWIDLRTSTFDIPSGQRPDSSYPVPPPKKAKKKNTVKKPKRSTAAKKKPRKVR